MIPQTCPFCQSSVSLVDSAKVYRRSYGFIYLCDRYPHCDAQVGCHPGSDKPLGTLANRELRQWRSLAHRQERPTVAVRNIHQPSSSLQVAGKSNEVATSIDSCRDVQHPAMPKSYRCSQAV